MIWVIFSIPLAKCYVIENAGALLLMCIFGYRILNISKQNMLIFI
jgi:hypothetical protein